jgi:hypothetical protein
MTTPQVIVLGLLEAIALGVIARLWLKRDSGLAARLIWSVVLLVPLFGLMAYFFLTDSPDEHLYDTDTMRSSAESFAEGDHH